MSKFNIGDRVKTNSNSVLNNGIVVKYKGKHDPREPRVRFASGWGLSFAANELRLLTEEEKRILPAPQLVLPCDV